MKYPILKIAFVAFAVILTSFAPPAKYKYSSDQGKFSVSFPAQFESEYKSAEDYAGEQIQATLNEQLYFMSYNIHEIELTDHEELASTSLDSFAETMGGTITSQSSWEVKKHKGLRAKISVPANDLVAEYRVVLIGQIQYQLVVACETANWNQGGADAFFKSFKVKK